MSAGVRVVNHRVRRDVVVVVIGCVVNTVIRARRRQAILDQARPD